MNWFSYFLLLFALSWAFVGCYLRYATDRGFLDHPNARSSHFIPTPRGGGVVFSIGWIATLSILAYFGVISKSFVGFFLPALFLGVVGFWEDIKGISSTIRFVFQILAAAASLYLIGESGEIIRVWLPILPLSAAFALLVFTVVWIINLYNFMDGSDGLAATQGIFVFGVGGYLLYQFQAYELSILAWSLCALLAGFLTWNWPVARIFMGDSGSCFLGLTIALFALLGQKYYQMPFTFWIILTGTFWFDATATLIRRMLSLEAWYKPHRSHAYQRLLQRGWSHQKLLLSSIVINILLSGLAIVACIDLRLQSFSLGVSVAILACLYLGVEIAKPMYRTWYDSSHNPAD